MRGVARWSWENPIPSLTLAGLVLYGLLRLSAALFYGRLGFQPEDVGLTYASTIGRALYGVLFLALAYSAMYFLVPSIAWLGGLIMRGWYRVTGRPDRAELVRAGIRARFERAWSSLIRAILSGVVILVLAFLPVVIALSRVGSVQNGQPQSSGVFSGYLWSAEAARVYPDRPEVPLKAGQCVLYLGHGDGYWALYDPATQTSWRVPMGVLTVRTGGALESVEQVPQDC